tara:strand:+ start:1394 stop:1597 length:204 start_codon:yes stop_codon:yes gene_type:complete
MSDELSKKNKDEYKSFKFGNYKIKFRKKIFKYVLIIIAVVFVGFPYLDLKMPTHSLINFQNSDELNK